MNTAVAAAMVLVGAAYSLFLRHTWNPQGWQLVADEALHDVMPVLFLIYWWFAVPKGAVRWTDIPHWCVYPVGYLLYALVRARSSGVTRIRSLMWARSGTVGCSSTPSGFYSASH